MKKRPTKQEHMDLARRIHDVNEALLALADAIGSHVSKRQVRYAHAAWRLVGRVQSGLDEVWCRDYPSEQSPYYGRAKPRNEGEQSCC